MRLDDTRCSYDNCQLREVICQLRFPAILSINEKAPADFQDAVRGAYPRYEMRREQPAPQVVMNAGTARVQQGAPLNNHNFISSTGLWRLNLAQNFFAITTLRYNSWEDLAQRLDRPLAEFIRIYKPAWFERIGLRYLNAFSRQSLGLEGAPWRELFDVSCLGLLSDPEIDEASVAKSSVETERVFPDGSHIKIHAGPGRVNLKGGQREPEVKFILDIDCLFAGRIDGKLVPDRLAQLHEHAGNAFRRSISEPLHAAMGPNPL